MILPSHAPVPLPSPGDVGPSVLLPWWLALVLGSLTALGAAGEGPGDITKRAPAFLDRHCSDCHSGKEPDGGLDVDQLALRFDDPVAAGHWTRIHDQLVAGEMPPKSSKEARPPAAEVQAITAWLRQQLHESSLARQQTQGRALVRRLNRVEYEYTLRDLLGVPVQVLDLLPEDGLVGGFDTVANGLDISATHLVRYQQAADRALAMAMPDAPPQILRETVSGKLLRDEHALEQVVQQAMKDDFRFQSLIVALVTSDVFGVK